MRIAKLLLALSVLAPPTAHAEQPVKPEESKPDNPERDKVVCKTEAVTGSRLRSRKVCMTRDQWEAEHRQMEKTLQFGGRQRSE